MLAVVLEGSGPSWTSLNGQRSYGCDTLRYRLGMTRSGLDGTMAHVGPINRDEFIRLQAQVLDNRC